MSKERSTTSAPGPVRRGVRWILAVFFALFANTLIVIGAIIAGLIIGITAFAFSDFETGLRFGFWSGVILFGIGSTWIYFIDYRDPEQERIAQEQREFKKMRDRGDV
ncbi:MAG: hypothetical protein AAGD96_20120 [Chloroflexota bacterium]